ARAVRRRQARDRAARQRPEPARERPPGAPDAGRRMSAPHDQACTCGCRPEEPDVLAVFNRPGQSPLDYRIATHGVFLHRMLAQIASWTPIEAQEKRPLGALTTRADNDPAIALLDAWATVGDVLTFYQERIANEGFLRTATERRSVLELARE